MQLRKSAKYAPNRPAFDNFKDGVLAKLGQTISQGEGQLTEYDEEKRPRVGSLQRQVPARSP